MTGVDFFHSHTPLWHNPLLGELRSLPGAARWAAKGIVFLFQVVTLFGVRHFQTLCEEFDLPPNMQFSYLQLKHALQTQFASGFPDSQMIPVVDVITGSNPEKLISTLYTTLRNRETARIIDTARFKWEADLGQIDINDWEVILENVRKTSPKLSERLTQLYIIHRSYLTPARIAKFSPNQNLNCPRCLSTPCSFFHLIWSCPVIQDYWSQIVKFLHDHMGSPIQLDPKLCLLGLLPDTMARPTATLLSETLFSARKLIAKHWMRTTSPAVQDWLRDVNTSLPYKKVLYNHRGCPKKYYKVWGKWLESTNTCSM